MATKAQKAEREEALEQLRGMLKPGDELHTILRHVSKSGMSRDISVIIPDPETTLYDATYLVARALGERVQDNGGIRMGGCGMDMGFALVYNLSRAMYPNGFTCAGDGEDRRHRCPANDHSNPERDPQTGERVGPPPAADGQMHHTDGGYALRQRWL